jgi:bacterioferritin-associated ferredoxin
MEKEVLCCCHDVTLEDVKNQIKLGVNSFDNLQEITKIGTDCPPCKEKNEKLFKILLNEELEK